MNAHLIPNNAFLNFKRDVKYSDNYSYNQNESIDENVEQKENKDEGKIQNIENYIE